MPEDISAALPHVRRMIEAFRIPVLTCDGYEADDIIGTLVRRAEKESFVSYMVTSDKDFGQLINEHTFLYKPSRMGDAVEVLGLPEIKERWGIQRPEQVVDILALMGDSSDNIPGLPGIGEKTAMKLIAQFGTVEDLLARTGELAGKQKENIEKNRDLAIISKKLATIHCDVPCPVEWDNLKVQAFDEEKVKALFVEFEFNSIGRRLFGEEFKGGRGFQPPKGPSAATAKTATAPVPVKQAIQEDLVLVADDEEEQLKVSEPKPAAANLKTMADVPHDYRLVGTPQARADLIKTISRQKAFGFSLQANAADPKEAQLIGLAFSIEPHKGDFIPLPRDRAEAKRVLEEFRSVLESDEIGKMGHDLKFAIGVLRCHGITLRGKLFDTMIAHSLIEPDMRHSLDYVSEMYLGYTPAQMGRLFEQANGPRLNLNDLAPEKLADYAVEHADIAWQLRAALEPLLKERGQERVFYEIEAPLISVLSDMELDGIKLDANAMTDFSAQLGKEIAELEQTICKLAGSNFNINSPRQLGQVLFDVLKICEKPKKTRTGQYVTDEQTLATLAPEHEIVRKLLEHRAATKLKSTYADALPLTISKRTGRVHTTFNQVMTATGRLNSQDPNLQNIPIRSERGQEIRKAFVPRGEGYKLLSADYSQIELRIIAALSKEAGLLEAFTTNTDVHTATAAKVFNVFPEMVTAEMRRKAKMVNYGIAYGISAFGLSQRLAIPRKEAQEIIGQYFAQFPGIRHYMDETIAFAREHGYVETVTGRRRYLRDIRSSHNTIRGSAERNAINAPIQGTAADMIKLAMIHIHQGLTKRNLKTRMLLQVHDELVFDLWEEEEKEARSLIEEKMKTAISLDVPIVVEVGVGDNWLEAH
jgi:DNA polymerase-1